MLEVAHRLLTTPEKPAKELEREYRGTGKGMDGLGVETIPLTRSSQDRQLDP